MDSRPTYSEDRGDRADSDGSIRVSLTAFVWEIFADPSVRTKEAPDEVLGLCRRRQMVDVVQEDEREVVSGFPAEKISLLAPLLRFCEGQL